MRFDGKSSHPESAVLREDVLGLQGPRGAGGGEASGHQRDQSPVPLPILASRRRLHPAGSMRYPASDAGDGHFQAVNRSKE
jgi:hypothetical protein